MGLDAKKTGSLQSDQHGALQMVVRDLWLRLQLVAQDTISSGKYGCEKKHTYHS